jgi:hypothetical protein
MIELEDVLGKVQLWSGPKLFLRFYGRFVFVRMRGMVRVLAVDVQSDDTSVSDDRDCDVAAISREKNTHVQLDDNTHVDDRDCHIPFMTLREKNVDPDSVKASSRIMGTEIAPFQGALNVWNLTQWTVTVQGDGIVSWPDDEAIPLADLKQLSGSDIHPRYLPPGRPGGRVTAIIDISGGYGFSFHLPDKDVKVPPLTKEAENPLHINEIKNPFGTRYDIVTVRSQHTPVPDQRRRQALADMVQITLNLPTDGVTLTIDKNDSSTPPTANKESIRVRPAGDEVVVLSFSNLCSGDLQRGPDVEFAHLYCVLQQPGPYQDRKIPTLYPAGGVVADSVRFGDCFLGAMISASPTAESQ